jgi:hypothetical protein
MHKECVMHKAFVMHKASVVGKRETTPSQLDAENMHGRLTS